MNNDLKLDLASIAANNDSNYISEEYINCVHNSQKEIRIKNQKTKKTIKKALYMLGGAAMMSAALFAYTQQKGKEKLGLDMKHIIEEQNYEVFIDSHDPTSSNILANGKATDNNIALSEIVNEAKEEGYNNNEIFIGLDYLFPDLNVQEIVQKPTLAESIAVKKDAFLNYEKTKGATK